MSHTVRTLALLCLAPTPGPYSNIVEVGTGGWSGGPGHHQPLLRPTHSASLLKEPSNTTYAEQCTGVYYASPRTKERSRWLGFHIGRRQTEVLATRFGPFCATYDTGVQIPLSDIGSLDLSQFDCQILT